MLNSSKLTFALFFTRVSILLVLLMWTVDKFLNPAHTAQVFESFYGMPGTGATLVAAIGAAELLLLVLFFLGIKKTFSYGAVLVIHGVSTLAAFGKYFAPFESVNLLFFAAWPMLAACVLLFVLREQDTFLQVAKVKDSE